MFGCRCRIYLHPHVSEHREHAITHYGTLIHRIPGTYRRLGPPMRRGRRRERLFSGLGHRGPRGGPRPGNRHARLRRNGGRDPLPTRWRLRHPRFRAGGRGRAGRLPLRPFLADAGPRHTRCVVVEPSRADCIARSIAAGRPTPMPGDLDTFMACLAAGEVSRPVWIILEHGTASRVPSPPGGPLRCRAISTPSWPAWPRERSRVRSGSSWSTAWTTSSPCPTRRRGRPWACSPPGPAGSTLGLRGIGVRGHRRPHRRGAGAGATRGTRARPRLAGGGHRSEGATDPAAFERAVGRSADNVARTS